MVSEAGRERDRPKKGRGTLDGFGFEGLRFQNAGPERSNDQRTFGPRSRVDRSGSSKEGAVRWKATPELVSQDREAGSQTGFPERDQGRPNTGISFARRSGGWQQCRPPFLSCASDAVLARQRCAPDAMFARPRCASDAMFARPRCASDAMSARPRCASDAMFARPRCASDAMLARPRCAPDAIFARPRLDRCARDPGRCDAAVVLPNSSASARALGLATASRSAPLRPAFRADGNQSPPARWARQVGGGN
jgi:hypothetical protein